METDRLLDVDEVAAILSVGKNTVYSLAVSGEIPSVKLGRRRRFFMSDVRAFLEGHRDQHQAKGSS